MRRAGTVAGKRKLTEAESDRLFHALADATRRDIVRRTLREQQSVSALARHYPMSFAAVQKHVTVLERAGAVIKRPRGREQLVQANIGRLRPIADLFDQFEQIWRARLNQIDILLTEQNEEESQ